MARRSEAASHQVMRLGFESVSWRGAAGSEASECPERILKGGTT